ncbi:MAG: hypothetical protein IPI56_10955 [Elusimicrobia bacterium]|nr:hypothetical protein [Elusimicrobiota bacterium]
MRRRLRVVLVKFVDGFGYGGHPFSERLQSRPKPGKEQVVVRRSRFRQADVVYQKLSFFDDKPHEFLEQFLRFFGHRRFTPFSQNRPAFP